MTQHRDGTHGHRCRCTYGAQKHAKDGIQRASGQWNANHLVDKCPEQILLDGPHGAPRELHSGDKAAQVIADEGAIGRFHRHIRTRSNGNAKICLG